MNQQNQEQNEQTGYQLKVEKKHNYFYKITNLINGKFYYGIRSTNKTPEDDVKYMGSGRNILKAINKYGLENFQKEIVANYSTRKEASDHEKLVVTMDLVLDENCYNLRCGGDNENHISEVTKEKLRLANIGKNVGVDNSFYGMCHTEETKEYLRKLRLGTTASFETREKISKALSQGNHPLHGMSGSAHPLFGYKHSEEFAKQISERNRGEKNGMFGKKHTDEAKEKISIANIGELNSFYGKNHPIELMRQIILNNPNRKPCSIEGNEFITVSAAAKYLNKSFTYVNNKLKSTKEEWKDWFFINK